MTPLARMIGSTFGGIFALKAAALLTRRCPRGAGWIAFLLAWPGVIPDWFRERRAPRSIDAPRFLTAWARMLLGAASIVLLAVFAPHIPNEILGFAGIAAVLLTVHIGV